MNEPQAADPLPASLAEVMSIDQQIIDMMAVLALGGSAPTQPLRRISDAPPLPEMATSAMKREHEARYFWRASNGSALYYLSSTNTAGADYGVLVHLRNEWRAAMPRAVELLTAMWRVRSPDQEPSPLQYLPGDYTLAALATLRERSTELFSYCYGEATRVLSVTDPDKFEQIVVKDYQTALEQNF